MVEDGGREGIGTLARMVSIAAFVEDCFAGCVWAFVLHGSVKRGDNVANRRRQGFGGQDVKVLPIANSNFQLATLVLIIGNILTMATFKNCWKFRG